MSAKETAPCVIALTQGKLALVDPDLYPLLAIHRWCTHSRGYACRSSWTNGKASHLYMHREVLRLRDVALPSGNKVEVDHINRLKCDNRSENLRVVTRAENARNACALPTSKTGIRGVHRHGDGKKWAAQIGVNYKRHHLGLFDTPEAAAEAYAAAVETLAAKHEAG